MNTRLPIFFGCFALGMLPPLRAADPAPGSSPADNLPPDEQELTFSAYGHQGTDVCGVNLRTRKVVNYANAPGQYDEPEGIFPDGQFTLVECDKQNLKGAGYVDLWRLKLDGSGAYDRLTYFSDYPGYKASNPVVSDNGRFIAFQMAKSREAAGVGHGIFVLDLDLSRTRQR